MRDRPCLFGNPDCNIRMTNETTHSGEYELFISPKASLLQLNLKEVWRYRDLVALMIKRDFIATYKQTILGPVWFFIQPLFTTLLFTLLFTKIGGLNQDGPPPMLFYLCGITFWNYFSGCLKTNASTFVSNQNVFGKVYFPRLVIPISVTLSNLIKLGIQFLLFALIYAYFILFEGRSFEISKYIVLLPLNIFLLGMMGLGLGILISSLTTKYRDITYLLEFGLQLLMYATVIFPVSAFGKYKWVAELNPLMSLIETTKLGLLGSGTFSLSAYLYCIGFTVVSLFIGVILFNKAERNFMDVV